MEKQKEIDHRVVAWEDVSGEDGTGVVHIAPGCGAEDFELGKREGLDVVVPIDDEGIILEGFGFMTGHNTKEVAELVFDELEKDWCSGITFSGGDPLYLDNREDLSSLMMEIKEKFPDRNIWCYTGYTWEELMKQVKDDKNLKNSLNSVDVLLEGRFVLGLALEKLHYVGSSNQCIIDVKKSLKENKKILYIDNSELES